MKKKIQESFWRNKRVLLTGHTGFKGAWLALWLERLGAEVYGFALPPPEKGLFDTLAPWPGLQSIVGNLVNKDDVQSIVEAVRPQIVFHMAAQALVRPGYADPVGTITTNVLGTAHLLDSLRNSLGVEAIIVITSDKAYENDGSGRAFTEQDALGGSDPYSGSKGAQEIIAHSFRRSYFEAKKIPIATARAGNVVGGGDWSVDRLVPDLIRAIHENRSVRIRNPQSTRPWQHVLDPLAGYLLFAQKLAHQETVPSALNFAPPPDQVRTVASVADRVIAAWPNAKPWVQDNDLGPAEAKALVLNANLAKQALSWQPLLDFEETMDWTVAWYRAHNAGEDMRSITLAQINTYSQRMT